MREKPTDDQIRYFIDHLLEEYKDFVETWKEVGERLRVDEKVVHRWRRNKRMSEYYYEVARVQILKELEKSPARMKGKRKRKEDS